MSPATPWHALKALEIASEEGRSGRPSGTARTPPPGGSSGGRGGPARPALLDGTGAKSGRTPGRGWGPTHQRAVEAVPHGHRKTITGVAALRADGPFAPVVVDGATTGDLFRAHGGQHPAPAPRAGDVVVVDNPPGHQVAGAAAAVERVGAALADLPPYSPDLNPIERAFAQAEGEIRRRPPRTVAGTERPCGEARDWFPPDGCQNSFRHAGYGPQGSH